ncbi:hypothetical protein P885DRAFT_65100 [Corynascus similis CBS 632.67]
MSLSGGTAQQRSMANSAANSRAKGTTAGSTAKERVTSPATTGNRPQHAAGAVNYARPSLGNKAATGNIEKPQTTGPQLVTQSLYAGKPVKQCPLPPASLVSSHVRKVVRDNTNKAGSETSPAAAPKSTDSKVASQQQKQVFQK